MTTNRKLNEILIREDGFSKTEISVSEGETLVFYSNSKKKTENFSYENIGLVQVVPDDNGENFRPVVGGYIFEQLDAKITLKFKVIGEFLFKLKNHPSNPAPCKVKVVHEVPLNASIADDGFHPKIIKIDEGQSIKWSWSKLSVPITIFESSVCESHYELQKKTKDLVTPSSSNDYTRKFDLPGVYYFQSESKSGDKCDLCVVEVQSSYREHTVEIFDNKFSPARITIEEGDLIWFHWNKNKCLKKHCIYQIYPPTPDHPSDRAYIPVKNGFKWSTPTRNGMVCHKFEKCGVYYYGDISGNECASYIGIIAVKPKSENTTIPFVEETKQFEQSVLTVETGDLIWFKWNKTIPISIKLDEACLVNDKTRNKKSHNQTECQRYDSKVIQRCGVYAFKITYAGCYYFCINNETDKFSLTVIASPALKDHKITITDSEAKPNILNINPEDRVWFVWDDTKRSQNIRQVNHANKAIVDGFLSGSLMESPGTFVESFNNLGIFYYTSDNFKGIMGAIVVVPEPGIHVVLLNERGPQPDPIVIKQNDVVIWKFDSEQTNDVVLIKKESDLYSYSESSKEILPRKYLSHAFKESGVYHFVSPSFDMTVRAEFIEAARGLDNTILSTVVVDNIEEYTTVYVDKEGFHPDIINVEVGKSILFDWRESNESHNITHISLPNERNSYKAITGSKAFTSGSPVVNNSFLHLFEEEGQFCVTSDGSQKHYCIIKVLNSAQKALTPQLCNKEPFILFKYHKIYLDCQTPNVDIHYTTDGSAPSKLTAKYNRDTGVIMNEEGINIIRAIAYSEHYLTSDIFTSHRFYVVNDPEPEIEPYRNTEPVSQSSNLNLEWWKCIPKITINSLGVGLLEIFWDRILEHLIPYISHYQIFLNKVSYRKYIPANVNKVLIKGLTGGRNYDIIVMIYPKDRSLLPQQSNIVAYNSPKTTSLGGPIISLKANRQKDQITICWLSIDPEETFIKSYELLINGKKHDEVRSSPGRHKITIEGCKPDTKYSIILVAVPKDGSLPLISNELEVILPLNLNEISLPDSNLRNLEKDFYDEYIEITDLESIRTNSLPKAPEVIDEELLPVAKVSVSHVSTGRIAIDWYMTDLPPSYLELTHYVIILIGNEFSSSIKSDAR
ncbi:unnamed protein product [Brachionus calyciflorus]|uniref:Uncharacterized protein n=1 Tax=Brachionus calyciflorus TaxID=104777 RepID=A0A813RJ27_9BILA|nr:unnamed protein product [Brachionus calyciflorus]